jgi:hypothetical protein
MNSSLKGYIKSWDEPLLKKITDISIEDILPEDINTEK